MLGIIILTFTAISNSLLGLLVYLKNTKGATNRFFFLLTSTFVVWSTVNYISIHPIVLSQLVWVRLVLFCGALLNLSVFLTFLTYPSPILSAKYKRRARIALAATLFIMPLTLTPFIFKELSFRNGTANPVPGPAIPLFALHTLSLIGASIFTLIKKYRTSHGMAKNQLRLVLFGTIGTFSLIVLTNFILVVAFNITALVPLGPAFTLLFSGSLAYGMIRHRLFDIRAAVARALAYILSLSSLGFIYAATLFVLSESVLKNNSQATLQRSFYIVVALFTAIIYPPTKRFFDRTSNRIFFRDAYDPQTFLDELNNVLVAQVELESLLSSSLEIIERNVKASNSVFSIRETSYEPMRTIASGDTGLSKDEIERILPLSAHIHDKVIVADLLDEKDEQLRKKLNDKDISIIVRLVTTLDYEVEGVGLLLLGPKKSGNAYTNQDIQLLEIIANELVIAIQNALRFEEIDKFNVTLQNKIDDATHQLRNTNKKLKALDETKDEFISMASHQLRTPLTSVKGYLSMVLEGDAGELNDMQRKLLDQAFISSQRMVYLIADLLNVSRLRTGKFIIEATPTNLADVVQGEVEQLLETADGRGLKLEYDKPENFSVAMLDETKIRQVVMNFIDNAIYYTPSGGHITVKLRETDDIIEFTVHDDGIGVPKHEQHHLFTKFYRAGNAKKARPDGTGLGLFMAKKVIVAQGGTLIFNSEEGKGSTFGFSFAKAKVAPPIIVTDPKEKAAEPTATESPK
jgi:signal transduction histidine kinase